MTKKISILGTEYEYSETCEKDDPKLCGKDGYCDAYVKAISIEVEHNKADPEAIGDLDGFQRKVKMHEIIHAYFFEAGLQEWALDEKLVDWIAWQFPKMLETFKEVDAI